MEQVIKFRMWNYVSQNPSASKMFYDTDEVMECLKQQLLFNDKSHKFHSLGYDHCGDGNVFMQFTGLLDKHGKEIYCGDKLKGKYQIWIVVGFGFCEGIYGLLVKTAESEKVYLFDNSFQTDSEIIGNIHQIEPIF